MTRWLRFALIGAFALVLGLLLVAAVLLVTENDRWEAVELHPWIEAVLGAQPVEVWLPLIMAGWLAAVLFGGAVVIGVMLFVWRRRQYESLITRLERELVELRNLPFTDPAPFDDLPEQPAAPALRRLAAARAESASLERVKDERASWE